MHVTMVHINLKPKHVEDFIVASRATHLASTREQSADNPTQFGAV